MATGIKKTAKKFDFLTKINNESIHARQFMTVVAVKMDDQPGNGAAHYCCTEVKQNPTSRLGKRKGQDRGILPHRKHVAR